MTYLEVVMPKRYPKEFRREVCERLLAGESVSSLSKELGVSAATLYLWRRQSEIDHDLRPGAKSIDVNELARAQRTIEELEEELAIVRAASAIFNGEEPISPKGGARLPRR
ncbi:MAG: transposase [Acidimicrobiales bacterium]